MLIPFKELFPRYGIKEIGGIIHVGGNTAQERCAYDELNIPRVLWVEPISDVFEQMKANLEPFPNQIALKALISDVDDKEVLFNISNNEAQSSSMLALKVHAQIHPEVHYVRHEKMKTIRLDTLFNILERDDIKLYDFLVADVQGSEFEVIKSLGKHIEHIDFFYLELNKQEVYEGGALMPEIVAYLKEKGFTLLETSDFFADCWGDGFFARTSMLAYE